MSKIYPRCKTEFAQPYISAHGYYFPCSLIGTEPNRSELEEFLGDLFQTFDIKKVGLADAIHGTGMQFLEASFETNPPKACRSFCGTPITENSMDRNTSVKGNL
jgi:hypothetical protein